MQAVLKTDGTLAAPTVGTWRPRIGRGAPLEEGRVLGVLHRAGRDVEVRAPSGAGGIALEVASAGQWLAYGDRLVEAGEGIDGLGAAPPPAAVDHDVPPGVIVVRAETDGTIYLRPEPSAPLFAPSGAEVDAHQTIALIEVMKTFNPVRSPVAGTVERVLVGEAAAVGSGDALLWVRTGTETA